MFVFSVYVFGNQETIIESDNEVLELMGRVDEGVEEFFTKRVLPTDTLWVSPAAILAILYFLDIQFEQYCFDKLIPENWMHTVLIWYMIL